MNLQSLAILLTEERKVNNKREKCEKKKRHQQKLENADYVARFTACSLRSGAKGCCNLVTLLTKRVRKMAPAQEGKRGWPVTRFSAFYCTARHCKSAKDPATLSKKRERARKRHIGTKRKEETGSAFRVNAY